MQFNHDNMPGVRLAEALVNMRAEDTWTAFSLQNLLEKHLFKRPQVAPETDTELRVWTARLQQVFSAEDQAERCMLINGLLADGIRRCS